MSIRVTIDRALTNAETTFNVLGSIPAVAMFSGSLRAVAGKVQFVVATILTGISSLGSLFSRSESEQQKWDHRAKAGLEYMTHGALNFCRGVGEAFLGYTLFGSLIPLYIQLSSKEMFAPRYGYSSLACRHCACLG